VNGYKKKLVTGKERGSLLIGNIVLGKHVIPVFALLCDVVVCWQVRTKETSVMRKFCVLWVCAAGIATGAWAKPAFLQDARDFYPEIVGTKLDSCTLCHISTNPPAWNDYGNDYGDHDQDFAAIESLDSDGDGVSNVDEIADGTFPGNATDSLGGTGTTEGEGEATASDEGEAAVEGEGETGGFNSGCPAATGGTISGSGPRGGDYLIMFSIMLVLGALAAQGKKQTPIPQM